MTDRKTSGTITADPAVTMSIGERLHFAAVAITMGSGSRAAWLENWGSPEGVLLSMQFRSDGPPAVDGSAVMVAPGVALCATHVIEPHRNALLEGRAGAVCCAITSGGMLIWRIRKVTSLENSDLTILGLELASDLPPGNLFHQARISTRMPRRGESVLILGFRTTTTPLMPKPGKFRFAGQVLACQGIVTERYDTCRDSKVLTWPVIEVDCPSWGGMSGGPAFDTEGNLIGLLATSIEGEGDPSPSYVSQIWPILGVLFEGGWPASMFPNRHSLLEMDPSICSIDDRTAIRVERHEDGRQTTWFQTN